MMKFAAAFIGIAITIVLIGTYLAPDDLARCTATPEPESSNANCHVADAIVAVSGGDTVARTEEAISLFRRGWAPMLVFSGAAADKTGPSNAHAMRDYALQQGIPAEAIIIESNSETTHENARLSRGVLVGNRFSRVILVTSGYHQRRASIEFRRANNDIQVVNHPVERDNQWSQWWWLTPNGWILAISEITKILLVYLGASR